MPLPFMRKPSRSNELLLLSLGATVGVIAGALLMDRVGGLDRLLSRTRRRGPGDGQNQEPELIEPPYGLHDADGSFEVDHDDDYDDYDESDVAAELEDDDEDPYRPDDDADHSDASSPPGRRLVPDVLTLESRVLEAFHNDPVLLDRAIDIGAIAPGVIELTGWVHTAEEVRHALTIARGVPDVHHVVDQLAVRKPTRNRRATDRMGLSETENSNDADRTSSSTRAD